MNVSETHVLIVDDVPDNRDLLARRLRRLGIERIVEAGDGEEALEAIAHNRFDLVLLDVMMPVVGGIEVLERLRSAGRLSDLPVLVISAANEIESIVRCIELGAEDFIAKPFNPTLLRARVMATLEKKFFRDAAAEELRRKRSELAEARILQMALKPPDFDGSFGRRRLRVETRLAPAMEVGGDLVDHFRVDGRFWIFILGDVSDKGAGAALMMARTHALFRSLMSHANIRNICETPEEAVRAVNTTLAENNERCMFVTLFFAVLDIESFRLRYVRAGHVKPFLLHPEGASARLAAAGGLPLGLDERAVYTSATIEFRPGDELLAVTDGVTEAFDAAEQTFGEERLQNLLDERRARRESPMETLFSALRAFTGDNPQSDDIAALYLTVRDN